MVNPPACSSLLPAECLPAACHWRCALEVIDELLGKSGAIAGEEADLLLDLRWQLREGRNAEAALRLFCELRLRLEQRHYLPFFRIRRWLENHVIAAVRICPAATAQAVPLKLDHYCVEAVRRVCLCSTLGRGEVLLAPRLEFQFRPSAKDAASALPAVA